MNEEPEKRLILLDGVECEIISIGKTEVCYKKPNKPNQAFPIECKPVLEKKEVGEDEEGNPIIEEFYTITDRRIQNAYKAQQERPAPINLAQELYKVFESWPVEIRDRFDPDRLAIDGAIKLGDYERAIYRLNNADSLEGYEKYREQFVDILSNYLTNE